MKGNSNSPGSNGNILIFSYGGSSILSTFLLFQVVQGLYILKKNEEEEYEEG